MRMQLICIFSEDNFQATGGGCAQLNNRTGGPPVVTPPSTMKGANKRCG
jgi:hypothetical protein